MSDQIEKRLCLLTNICYFLSSSRFTDSKRYEHTFDKCFLLEIHRSGEICNACVLLVKRFLKLPKGSARNWSHVVDARSGPGIKAVGRNRNNNNNGKASNDSNGMVDTPEKVLKRKHVYKRKRAQRKPNKSTIKRRAPEQEKENFDIALTLDPSYWKK